MTIVGVLSEQACAAVAEVLVEALPSWPPSGAERQPGQGRWWRPRAVGSNQLPWPARAKAYNWAGDDHVSLDRSISGILDAGRTLAERLLGGGWSTSDKADAVHVVGEIFDWGGIRRPKALTQANAQAVFAASLCVAGVSEGSPSLLNAPWSSGWTKVAAFATRHLDGKDDTAWIPQVIWDSRAANGVRRLVDLSGDRLDEALLAALKGNLRQVKGRGGTRKDQKLIGGWAWASTPKQQWRAQSEGSRLVRHIRDHLNSNLQRHGAMPTSDGAGARWTSWGVGLALFVEGY